MSIFKDTFKDDIQKQLKARQNAILNRTPNSIQYLNSRNAWIRMTSSVDVDGDKGALASKYILQGGNLDSNGKLRSGVGTTNSAYSRTTADNITNQRGLRPMPGIVDIDVKSKSAYGSLREITVNFQCWDIKQLEELELLYMRPGYTVLIEWGWLPYLKDENSLAYTVDTYDIINTKRVKEDIWKDIFAKSLQTGGNYDSMFGYIKNYNWSARPDGGYDCRVDVISIGEILESLKINYSPLNIKLVEGGTGLLSDSISKEVVNKYKKNVLAGLFSEFYEIVDKAEAGSGEGVAYNYKGYDFFVRETELKNSEATDDDAKVGASSDLKQIYITLGGLIYLLNNKVLLKDENSGKPVIEFSIRGRAYNGDENDLLLCLAHPLQLSVDPTTCIIKNIIWGGASDSTSYLKNTGLKDYFKDNDPYTELGIIGNIYINLQYLYTLSTNSVLETQDKKEKQEISVYDFLKNVLATISDSTGNVNNFDIHVDPIDSKARIIDINYVDSTSRDKVYKDSFELQVGNLKSTVRSYKLESQIFPEQATTIAIGSQVQGGTLGTDSNTMSAFNKNISDRTITRKTDPTQDNTKSLLAAEEEQLTNLKENLKTLYSFFVDTSGFFPWSTTSAFDINKAGSYRSALRDVIRYFVNISNSRLKNSSIIPIKFSAEMDGIGGLVIGHIFKLPLDILPRGYKGDAQGGKVGSKIGFLITGLGHKVSNKDWTTSIDSQFIILDNPTGSKINYSDFLKDLVVDIVKGDTDTAGETISAATDPKVDPPPVPKNLKATPTQIDAMKQAGNATYEKNGETPGKCARYSYTIAYHYSNLLKGKTTNNIGSAVAAGGNAKDEAYRNNLKKLGWKEYSQGKVTKTALANSIKTTNWEVGDIIIYWAANPNAGGSSHKYGHTQIYTGGILNKSASHPWATSNATNYKTQFVYNSINSDDWYYYIFKAPKPSKA